jgi:hypothetical protein
MQMKKVKVILWLLILGALGLVIYQNRDFFLAKQSLGLFLFNTEYRSPDLYVALLFLAFFFIGWFLAYLFGLGERFVASKTIKKLQQTINAQQVAIDAVKKDIASLRPQPATAAAANPSQAENEVGATLP